MLALMVEQPAETMTARRSIRPKNGRVAALLFALVACPAFAQTPPAALDLRLQPLPDVHPQADEPVAPPDEEAADKATSVHGSFTTGIGTSKNYGNSTLTAAEVDVNKQYDNGKALNLHIDVFHSTGLPPVAPRDYVSRYPGY